VGFEEHNKQMVLQPRSSTNLAIKFCVHPMIHVPIPSSSDLHVDVEPNSAK